MSIEEGELWIRNKKKEKKENLKRKGRESKKRNIPRIFESSS